MFVDDFSFSQNSRSTGLLHSDNLWVKVLLLLDLIAILGVIKDRPVVGV